MMGQSFVKGLVSNGHDNGQRSILKISTSGFSISFVKAKSAKGLSVTRVVVTGISFYGVSMVREMQRAPY